MSQNLLNKYVWLFDTIYRHKFISFERINELWLENDMSDGLEIPKRTFHTWILHQQTAIGKRKLPEKSKLCWKNTPKILKHEQLRRHRL